MAKRILYVLLAVVLVVDVPWAEDLRFAHSRAEMAEFARGLGKGAEVRDVHLGWLSFAFVRHDDDGVVFYRGRTWGQDGYGYIWNPVRKPGEFRHLTGPWYWVWNDAHM
ncbi:hypothetical protein [Herbidospora daliensis]|uniref:hypothetical protein n=1 Tax=Herbidospora daliensis TaxID=295585 RepID=UPI00078339B5|nr:hypothetical protein [Herbidospora daliensis]